MINGTEEKKIYLYNRKFGNKWKQYVKSTKKRSFDVDGTNGHIKRVTSYLTACIIIRSGFQDDYNQLNTKSGELKPPVPSTNTNVSFSNFLGLQWNYTNYIQEYSRCEKEPNGALFWWNVKYRL